MHYYWQATLHYELQLNVGVENESAICSATIVDQLGSKTPHLIKSKCISVPASNNRSIDVQFTTKATTTTVVTTMPTVALTSK